MKILVIAPTPFFADRGTHIRVLEEALALEKRGHQITIATYHIGRDVRGEVKTGIDIRRVLRLLFWYQKLEAGPDWQKIILDIMLIRKVFYLARTQRPRVIHAHLHEGVLIGWIVRNLLFWREIKLVADFHGSLVREMESHGYLKNAFIKPIFKFLEKFISRLGDRAIASSWENSQIIGKSRKVNDVLTVPDGVNLDRFRALPPKADLKKELKLPMDRKIVVYSGALIKNKGINLLFKAIKLIAKKRKDAYFIIAGFPGKSAENFVRANNLRGDVRIISPLNYFDLPRILAAGDIAVDPKDSAVRQASGKILQYMGAGLPIVCFNKKNNRKYLGSGAYFSPEVSGQGLARGIIFFLDNPEEARKKGRIAAERAKFFGWERSAEKIEEIYKRVKSSSSL
jgi:glycosyltransferase involved in cell wall biosynthesis